MSPEDCMRTVLATLTLLVVLYIVIRKGRLPNDTQFWVVVTSLIVFVVLAADECRTIRPLCLSLLTGREAFAEQVQQVVVDATQDLQALPWTAYKVVGPVLGKLASMIRGEGGGTAKTKVLKEVDYSKDKRDIPTLGSPVDKKKFAAMKLEYKQIVYFLCRMKSLLPDTHDKLITAIASC